MMFQMTLLTALIVFMHIAICTISANPTNRDDIKQESKITTNRESTTRSPAPETDLDDYQIESEAEKFIVYGGASYMINRFSVSTNFTFECNLKYLSIVFPFQLPHGDRKRITAYLHSRDNKLSFEQKVTDVCRKIRRQVFLIFVY